MPKEYHIVFEARGFHDVTVLADSEQEAFNQAWLYFGQNCLGQEAEWDITSVEKEEED